MGLLVIKIRWSWKRLVFMMGIPIPLRKQFYIETPDGYVMFCFCDIIIFWWVNMIIHPYSSGPLFTKPTGVLPQDLVKFRSCEIGALEFARHIGSSAAEMRVKFQSDTIIITSNLATSRHHEILVVKRIAAKRKEDQVWIHLPQCLWRNFGGYG